VRNNLGKRTVFMAAVMASVGTASAQTNVIPNPNFNIADVSWWQGPTQASSSKSWSAFGNPGGSLLLESTLLPPHLEPIEVQGPCISGPSGEWIYRGQVFNASEGALLEECAVFFVRYEDSTCSGPPIFDSIDLGPQPQGVWVDREAVPLEINQFIHSFRPTLVATRGNFPGTTRCYFDNLELLSPGEQVIEVPAIGPAGMWALIGLLLLAGLRTLSPGKN
jgi:hypothetical protein